MNFVNSESPQDERRRFERSRLIIDVFFDGEDLTGVASTQDISPGGLYMNTQAEIPEGAVLTLRIPLEEQVKPEMIQSQAEVGTGICRNIGEARADITNLRSVISTLARNNGLAIAAASTHPISHWSDQRIFDDAHYTLLIEELQMVARSLLIF